MLSGQKGIVSKKELSKNISQIPSINQYNTQEVPYAKKFNPNELCLFISLLLRKKVLSLLNRQKREWLQFWIYKFVRNELYMYININKLFKQIKISFETYGYIV